MNFTGTKSDEAVRLSRKTWNMISEFSKETKLKKKQVNFIVNEYEKQRKQISRGQQN